LNGAAISAVSRDRQLPLVEFACDLTRCGYRGPWSLEIFNDGFRASPNGATAKDGYRSLLWLEEQTRQRLTTAMRRCFTATLPDYLGLEFIEFAASPSQAGSWPAPVAAGLCQKRATAQNR
jgi:4-hydroxyphenylpyruvate dioxygenase